MFYFRHSSPCSSTNSHAGNLQPIPARQLNNVEYPCGSLVEHATKDYPSYFLCKPTYSNASHDVFLPQPQVPAKRQRWQPSNAARHPPPQPRLYATNYSFQPFDFALAASNRQELINKTPVAPLHKKAKGRGVRSTVQAISALTPCKPGVALLQKTLQLSVILLFKV